MARFEEVAPNRGADSLKPGAEWMMVPLGGSNLVRLSDGVGYSVGEPRGKRLNVNETEAKEIFGAIGSLWMPDARLFRVGSQKGGEATIQATKKGGLTATLKVSVHPRRTLKVAFFFLQDRDAAGTVTSRTTFTPSNANGWINGLNEVFGPQANILV